MKHAFFSILVLFVCVPFGAVAQIRLEIPLTAQRSFSSEFHSFGACAHEVQLQRYLHRLGELRWSLRKAGFALDGVRRVFYPAAAYDSAIASLFEGADIIAVDDNPACDPEFLRTSQLLRLNAGQGGSYLRLADIAREQYIGPRVLGGLLDSGHVIHEVLFFSVASEPFNTHMLAKFSGPNGKVRSYLQIQGIVPTTIDESRSAWWMSILHGERPDAVIAKSANHSLSPEGNPFMHSVTLEWLKQTGGIVLEGVRTRGFHPGLGAAEFAGGGLPPSTPAGVHRSLQLPFPGRFGYGDNVRALKFAER